MKKHFRQTFCPASRSRCIFKNSDSRERKVFFRDRMRSHAIACDRMQSHGSQESSHVQQGGLNSTCFHFYHRQTLHLVCHVVSHCTTKLPSQHPVVSSIALPYRPSSHRHTVQITSSHVVEPRHIIPSRCCIIIAAMPRKKDEEVAKKTAQVGLVEWKNSNKKNCSRRNYGM